MAQTEKLMDQIKGMTVLELNELVKALEDEFGVSAAAAEFSRWDSPRGCFRELRRRENPKRNQVVLLRTPTGCRLSHTLRLSGGGGHWTRLVPNGSSPRF